LKIYIYTIPKAGTYYTAEVLSQLGFGNTGIHVESFRSCLMTLELDMDTNREKPGKAQNFVNAIDVVDNAPDNSFLFGHCPLHLLASAFSEVKFLCCYRHPRQTLFSEFWDFRFRRTDIDWLSPQAIPDDRRAFVTYLERHSPVQYEISATFTDLAESVQNPHRKSRNPERFILVSFDDLRYNPQMIAEVGKHLGKSVSIKEAHAIIQRVQVTETKTKANYDRQPESFWTPEAETAYARAGFPELERRMQAAGLDIGVKAVATASRASAGTAVQPEDIWRW